MINFLGNLIIRLRKNKSSASKKEFFFFKKRVVYLDDETLQAEEWILSNTDWKLSKEEEDGNSTE